MFVVNVPVEPEIAEPAAIAIAAAAAVRTTQSTVTAPDSSFAKFLIKLVMLFSPVGQLVCVANSGLLVVCPSFGCPYMAL